MSLDGVEAIGTISWVLGVIVLHRREFERGELLSTALLCLLLGSIVGSCWQVAPLGVVADYPGQEGPVILLWTLAVAPIVIGCGWMIWAFVRRQAE